MKEKKNIKKLIVSLVFVLCMMSAVAYAEDSEETKSVLYVGNYTYDSTEYVQDGVKIAPKKDGYLFAGWFTSEDGTTYEAVSEPQNNTTYYAKFVPEEVLTIKAQVSDTLYDDNKENDSKAAIRFITSIDNSKDYEAVGFNIIKGSKEAEDAEVSNYVYRKLYAVDATDKTGTLSGMLPENLFHSASYYFKTWTISNIVDSTYNTEVTVTPYWVTVDGTRVDGRTAIKTVNMGRSWIYVDSTDTDSQELGTYDEPYKTLASAASCETPVDRTIILKSDIVLQETFAPAKSMTITTDNMSRTISFDGTNTYYPIHVDTSGIDVKFAGSSENARLIFQGIAEGYGRMFFYLKSANSVTMEHVDIQDAKRTSGGGGGAINSAVELTLKDCNFTNCSVTDSSARNGGAVTCTKALTVESCTFTNCDANGQGGAINRSGKNLAFDLKDCTFENCDASSHGGAVYVGDMNEINITSCIFTNNNSTSSYGGAVAIGTADSTLNIYGTCKFIGNSAKGSGTHFGGAILAPANLYIKSGANVVMTENQCTDYDYGDAISINTVGSSISTECTFIVEANAKLYVYNNPTEEDNHNDICTEITSTAGVGNPTEPTVYEGGLFSTTSPEE